MDERISAVEREAARQFWRQTEPPLWAAQTSIETPLQRQIDAAWNQHRHALTHLIDAPPRALGLWVLLALGALVWVRRRAKKEEWGLGSGTSIVGLLSVLLVQLVLTTPLDATVDLLLLLAGFFCLWITPRRVPAMLSSFALALGLVDWMRRLTAEGTLGHRIALVLTAVILLSVSIVLWRKGVRLVLWASAIGAAATLGAVLGFVPLAGVLMEASSKGGLAAVVLLTSVPLLEKLWASGLESRWATTLRSVRRHQSELIKVGRLGLGLIAASSWLWLVLGALRVRTAFWTEAKLLLSTPLTAGELSVQPGNILMFFAVVAAALVISRVVAVVLVDDVLPRAHVDQSVGHTAGTLTRLTILLLGLLAAASAAGIASDRVALVMGALGVGIGFGLQTLVNNFASGLILMFERPIAVGDTVTVGGVTGVVRDIGIRASRIHTPDGSDVFMPNGTLLQSDLTNWSGESSQMRVTLPIGVGYTSDLRVVNRVLAETVASVEDVLQEPTPVIQFVAFGASSLDFVIRFWVKDFDGGRPTFSALGQACHSALSDAGIEIPFPQQDVHIHATETEHNNGQPGCDSEAKEAADSSSDHA